MIPPSRPAIRADSSSALVRVAGWVPSTCSNFVQTALPGFQLPTSILSEQWLLLLVRAQGRHLWGAASWC
jgi:hypothetical protein